MASFFSDAMVVFWLVFLEGLLSVDNALVLAAMVSVLPPPQRQRALLYGIIGAYAFRVLAILFAAALLNVWWFRVLGGAYLLWLGYNGLNHKTNSGDTNWLNAVLSKFFNKDSGGFWAVIINVELMDMAFSIDSILAAVAMTEKIWLIILGGLLGILALRFVASYFIKFLEGHPIFKKTAYVLVLVIGLKLTLSSWWHAPETAFFTLLSLIFFGSYVVEYFQKKPRP